MLLHRVLAWPHICCSVKAIAKSSCGSILASCTKVEQCDAYFVGKRTIRFARIMPLSRHTAVRRTELSRLVLDLTISRCLIFDGRLYTGRFMGTCFTALQRQRSGLLGFALRLSVAERFSYTVRQAPNIIEKKRGDGH